jgi:hypothetical protein
MICSSKLEFFDCLLFFDPDFQLADLLLEILNESSLQSTTPITLSLKVFPSTIDDQKAMEFIPKSLIVQLQSDWAVF